MKTLNDILKGVEIQQIIGSADVMVESIAFDSRKVESNTLFIAQQGITVDGHQFIDMAIEKGASAIICQSLPENLKPNVTYIEVENSSSALGFIAGNYFDNPSHKLKLIGITGTNGKTTTVTLLHRLFSDLGFKVGMLSTIVNKIGNKEIPATHTTPDAIQLNQLLSEMVESGCEYVFMEVSSHAVAQQRIAGLKFFGGIFSNITHDHLDFHKTFDAYIKAKKAFFDNLDKDAFALVNKDDRNGMVMLQNTKAKKYTYSLQSMADFRCQIVDDSFQGLQLMIDGSEIWVKLVGRFNAYNLLSIYSVARLCGLEKIETLTELSKLNPAEGRFEYIQNDNFTAIVDYAHTPDALKNVLQTINEIREGAGQLITVVGCGGDRDKTKRPEMAKIATELSDKVILTSDNPRTENPDAILDDMEKGIDPSGMRKVLRISNRAEAIKTACMLAQKSDIVLIAGKGHEKYQEINGVKHHFDDKEELVKSMKPLNPLKGTFGTNEKEK
ncbi:UDP-N-acetylmuramoyl-L-alanyl-D-glutamate--2,6-diaminopimelate ligase [Bacteroidales bacterium OttesenSCG-928-C19]|nr:UDP-N-acetylmuramoyl-L-alanyl-D-glutamate--2,6-diaminopimelate ligase [Bacteroidales bacterium OttesenSCG-928-C19]